MLRLNIEDEFIHFVDIKQEQLPEILKWYNNVKEFKYATGIDKPIDMKDLIRKYEEVAICSSEFFVGIYRNDTKKMIGILKGRLKNSDHPVVWISSIAIDPGLQGQGYGGMALELLLKYFRQVNHIRTVYISVVEGNNIGMRFWIKKGFQMIRKIEKYMTLDEHKQNVFIMAKHI